MNSTITSSLIQDWFVINDDRWANVLTTGCVKGLQLKSRWAGQLRRRARSPAR